MGELNEGSAFGEMVFFGEPVRTATVRALSVCVCRVLHADAFNQALHAFPQERRKFEEIVNARRQAMNTLTQPKTSYPRWRYESYMRALVLPVVLVLCRQPMNIPRRGESDPNVTLAPQMHLQ